MIRKTISSQGQLANAIVDPRGVRGIAVGTDVVHVQGDAASPGTILFNYAVPAGAVLTVTDIWAHHEVGVCTVTFAETAGGTAAQAIASDNRIQLATYLPNVPVCHIPLSTPLVIDNSAGAAAVQFTAVLNEDFGNVLANAATDWAGASFRGLLET